MKLAGDALLIMVGVGLIGLSAYVVHLYGENFRSEPRRTITRDLITALTIGAVAVPGVLAFVFCWAGLAFIVMGITGLWISISY